MAVSCLLCQLARPLAFTVVLSLAMPAGLSAKVMDGFFAYCTSNLDGTGDCVNQEDGRAMDCIIVPGQIIQCNAAASKSFQCVWVSGVTANQAQFWCDPSAEATFYSAISDTELNPSAPSGPPAVLNNSGAGVEVFDQEF